MREEEERRQRQEREVEERKRRERQEKATMEERQEIQPATTVGFGRYYGKTCEWVYSRDREYCEWVSRQESTNRALLEFQEFVRAAERRDKRKELEMREKTMEENRSKKELEESEKRRREEEKKAEMEAKEKRAIQEVREVMTRMRMNIETPAENAHDGSSRNRNDGGGRNGTRSEGG